MFNKKEKGFTLIELLIVIGIIAILAAGIIIAINPGAQFENARNSTRWSHMNAIANSVYTYAVDSEGNFPPCISAVATYIDNCEGDLVPTYISAIPEDPQGGSGANNYQIKSVNGRIHIEPGTVDDDTSDMELEV